MLRILVLSLSIALLSVAGLSKKTSLKLNATAESERKGASAIQDEEMTRGSFMVASHCRDCNNGYKIDQISFSGFDKPKASAAETFFITNHTDRLLSGVTLYIDYRTQDGRQLNKRFVKLSCNIPAGETRLASVKSWDTQHSFRYVDSEPSRNDRSTPFTVVFDPVAYWLRF